MNGMDITQRIAERAKELGLKKADIARELGITRASVSQWFSGRTRPGRKSIEQLARILQTTEEWLRSGRGPKEAIYPPPGHTVMGFDADSSQEENHKKRAMKLLMEAGYTVETNDLPKIEISWNRFIIPTFRVRDGESDKAVLVQIYREWYLLGIPLRRIRNTKDFVFVSTDEVEHIVSIISEHFASQSEQAKTLTDLIAEHLSFSVIYKALRAKTDKLPPAARRAVAEMLSEAITSEKDTDTPRYIEKLLDEADREDTDESVSNPSDRDQS